MSAFEGIEDLGEEHGHRVLRVRGKGDKVVPTVSAPETGSLTS